MKEKGNVGPAAAASPAAVPEKVFHAATPDWADDERLKVISRLLHRVRVDFDMDVAFVSEFVGGQRVFRQVDTSEEAATLVQVGASDPLEESYCLRIVDGRLPEVIRNASELPEAAALAATRAIGIGAHLSVPIRLDDGRVFGTLCCFSRRADPSLGERDAVVMRELARIVAKTVVRTR